MKYGECHMHSQLTCQGIAFYSGLDRNLTGLKLELQSKNERTVYTRIGHLRIEIHQGQGLASLEAVEGMHQLRIKRNRVRVVGIQGEPVTVAGVWQRGVAGRGAMALEVGSVWQVPLPVGTAEQRDRVVHVPRHLQQAVGALGQPLQGAEPAQRRVYV